MRAALCKRLCHFTTCLPQSQFLPELTHIIIPFRGQRIHQLVNLPFQRTWFRLPQVPLVLAGRIGTQNHRPRIFHEYSDARPHSVIRGRFSLPQSQFLPELTHTTHKPTRQSPFPADLVPPADWHSKPPSTNFSRMLECPPSFVYSWFYSWMVFPSTISISS